MSKKNLKRRVREECLTARMNIYYWEEKCDATLSHMHMDLLQGLEGLYKSEFLTKTYAEDIFHALMSFKEEIMKQELDLGPCDTELLIRCQERVEEEEGLVR